MRRLSLSLIIVIVLSITSLGWLLNKIYLYTQPDSIAQLESHYGLLGSEIVRQLSATENKEAFIQQWNAASDFSLQLIDKDNFPLPPEISQAFESGQALVLESNDGIDMHYLLPDKLLPDKLLPDEQTDEAKVLAIAIPQSSLTSNRSLELILTISFYIGVIVIILIWIWPLLNELSHLRSASAKFGHGDLTARVKTSSLSYIKDIQSEFNFMADRIQSLIADNKLLSRAVSHDLKTPLSRLRFGLEALSEANDPQQKNRYAERINRDLEEMESLIDTLLQFARLDESRLSLKQEQIELTTLCQVLLEAHKITDKPFLSFSCPETTASIVADKRYITMLINNLLSNAVRYANQKVRLSISQQSKTLSLCVEDDGPGIAINERENVIKPFWKDAQSGNNGGHGMGLAIASRIAEWHETKLCIEDSSLGGAKICVTFKCE